RRRQPAPTGRRWPLCWTWTPTETAFSHVPQRNRQTRTHQRRTLLPRRYERGYRYAPATFERAGLAPVTSEPVTAHCGWQRAMVSTEALGGCGTAEHRDP